MKTFQDKVLDLVKKIPKGKVTTYKEIAYSLGHRGYRSVGQALKNNPRPVKIPCHRVVCADGSLGGYCGEMDSQKKLDLLKKEGVHFEDGKIKDFENYFLKLI